MLNTITNLYNLPQFLLYQRLYVCMYVYTYMYNWYWKYHTLEY